MARTQCCWEADAYTALVETVITVIRCWSMSQAAGEGSDYLGTRHSRRLCATTRGGDFSLHIGQDVSIGYSNHTDTAVHLYLQETFTFLLLTPEAGVALVPPTKA